MDERVEARVGASLRSLGMQLTLAESCTGGLISHRITNIAGSSAYYPGGWVVYANEAKQTWLGVSAETLAREGAVSEATVLEMARGARRGVSFENPHEKIVATAVSGIAGPGGGTPQKPVGMTCIAVSGPAGDRATTTLFLGSREEIKAQAAEQALHLLLEYLESMKNYIPTEVNYRTDSDGLRWVEGFTFDGRSYPVEDNGRRWVDEQGDHLLVQAGGGQVFELLFVPSESRWMLKRPDTAVGQV